MYNFYTLLAYDPSSRAIYRIRAKVTYNARKGSYSCYLFHRRGKWNEHVSGSTVSTVP